MKISNWTTLLGVVGVIMGMQGISSGIFMFLMMFMANQSDSNPFFSSGMGINSWVNITGAAPSCIVKILVPEVATLSIMINFRVKPGTVSF